jgi:hypothetical protein
MAGYQTVGSAPAGSGAGEGVRGCPEDFDNLEEVLTSYASQNFANVHICAGSSIKNTNSLPSMHCWRAALVEAHSV